MKFQRAVSVEQQWIFTVQLQALSAYLKIRNCRSVFRPGLVLAKLQSVGCEERRETFRFSGWIGSRAEIKTGWREEIRRSQKVVVGLVRVDARAWIEPRATVSNVSRVHWPAWCLSR